MGKLGKKARKFAKKNLQSVLRRKRKTKTFFKKKSSSKDELDNVENEVENTTNVLNGRNAGGVVTEDTSLDAIFMESDVEADALDSDGYLSEQDDSCAHVTESKTVNDFEDIKGISTFSTKNRKIHEELEIQKKKLDKLKKKHQTGGSGKYPMEYGLGSVVCGLFSALYFEFSRQDDMDLYGLQSCLYVSINLAQRNNVSQDPEFVKFLKSYKKGGMSQNEEMYSDEDEESNHIMLLVDEDESTANKGKVLSTSIINSWSQRAAEDHDKSALISLLNAYRDACHFGTESTDNGSCYIIQDSETFCNLVTFVLREADNIFRGLLKISSSTCKKETILEMKNTSKWKKLKPLLKSYLRSTLFLLNQVTDSELLALSLTRLRASIIFFGHFPSLLQRLIKISVHLWATGGGDLASCSFLVIRDVAVVFSSSCFDICFTKTYKSFIARCKVVEIVDVQHIEFLKKSFVELCSLNVQKSCSNALMSVQQLAKILQQGLRTKRKEAIKSICTWQYANCIDIWVLFISANVHDYSLEALLYTTVQLVNGVTYLFPGPRYFPYRLKCIQWLNRLSRSSGIFIPISSFVLDILEYNTGRDGGKRQKSINFSSSLKLPKNWLKSQKFQEECVFSVIEMLSLHFAQWSYHISFPDLATIPLIRLRKFYEITTVESTRRTVKRLIDQVEQNVEFVQKKRDEVAFLPKDQQNVESFLQLEKGSLNAPFTQYYKSVMEKAASRNLHMNQKTSFLEQKSLEKGPVPDDAIYAVKGDSEKRILSVNGETFHSRRKRRRVLKV